ncbi:proline--tRNA ligase [Carboxydothermus ferrireducens]|uniref:Proline--tRNA ligase n=1 Tax=Carboxydothermus ferrireducens DSM 11255 TaxID=1119529 RepID=A0ABX2RCD7_9THEO|nr:proline--tRNA ligase [Carboxydothermus ferrireducens]NYE58524.1 prolyl-tRNA synthetase [Carboxydothermus ferrireducens DSM 11255]
MRLSQYFMPTLRENPAEAEVISHKLLLRAGFIRKSASGVYTYLPLAQRVLKKIMQIIREEMDRQGGQELMLPILQPAELWLETGRWHVYGPELFKLKDRHNRDFCLGPTHEEIITDLVRREVRSYKELPLLLYQIQNKYRDEKRPRFGLMRGREFIMKDLYSFDRDEEGLEISYRKMYEAYTNVFTRCGLKFRAVEADAGAIGGSTTHEFMVLANSGEAVVVYCPDDNCGYAANLEKAETKFTPEVIGTPAEIQKVATPNVKTVDEVAAFLKVEKKQILKSVLFKADDGYVLAVVRGDREVNEVKVKNQVDCLVLELASPQEVEEVLGAEYGSIGPVGVNIPVIADLEVKHVLNAVTGANETGYHLTGVNPERDFSPAVKYADIRLVEEGEPCPKCGKALVFARGIEVGQIFKLKDKYSRKMGAFYLDENGQQKPIIMGCYGIGVTRTMAAAVEQNHDEDGIIWPAAIAPFEVIVVPVSNKDEQQMKMAEEVYNLLLNAGFEVVIDDRDERPGVKFKDADLIGIPLRITVGKRTVSEGVYEVKIRRTREEKVFQKEELVDGLRQLLKTL